jgi:hypothetical protein
VNQDIPAPPGYPAYPVAGRKVNGAAVASLVFAVIGALPFSIALGVLALSRIAKRGERGLGLAIAGLCVSAAWVTVAGSVATITVLNAAVRTVAGTPAVGTPAATTPVSRPPSAPRTGSTSGPGRRFVRDLTLGDCLSYVGEDRSPKEFVVKLCSRPHGGEVFSIWSPPAGSYPGDAALDRQAGDHCGQALRRYAVGEFAGAKLVTVYPTRDTWSHDRRVFCFAVPGSGQWTGSMVHP